MLKKLRKMLKKQEGFTLVELMIVVVILGILAGIGVQQYGRIQDQARENVNKANLRLIANAIRMYQTIKGEDPVLPAENEGTSFNWGQLEGYGLEAEPESPWEGGEYSVEKVTDSIVISNTAREKETIELSVLGDE
jgi:prepilin-type N-terminal cleavage/methylation domain-containing protein